MNLKPVYAALRLWRENKIRVTEAKDVALANMVFEDLKEAVDSCPDFDQALKFLLQPGVEGREFSNRKADRGGPTKCGVTQAVYDDFREKHDLPKRSVAEIEEGEAPEIYYTEFWLPAKCDILTSSRLALVHFDTAVQRGPVNAIKMLQKILGSGQDGVVGPRTLAFLRLADERSVIRTYLDDRLIHYENECKKDPSQLANLNGWKNRLELLKKEVLISDEN